MVYLDPEKAVEKIGDVELTTKTYDGEELAALFDKHFGTGKRGAAKPAALIKDAPGLEDRNPEEKKKEETKKKSKKPKYPKNFDPENPGALPDPERWLPKWQRTKYRKKHGGGLQRGPQGGFTDVKTRKCVLKRRKRTS